MKIVNVLAMSVTLSVAAVFLSGCPHSPQPITTPVGLGVATLVKTTGFVDPANNCNPAVPTAPDAQGQWNAQAPAGKTAPFAGFQIWRNTTDGCLESRKDVYRALATFNMAAVSNLKGLVQTATLTVKSQALPSGVGAPGCPAMTAGAGTFERFGPAATGTLPTVSGVGSFDVIPPAAAFPTGQAVSVTPTPSGTGGFVFTLDVTSQVNAALNGGIGEMSWMLDSSLEGPLAAPATAQVDCRTSINFAMTITHF